MLNSAQPTQYAQNRLNMWAMLKALVANDVGLLVLDGTPVNGTSGSFAGFAGPASLLFDNVHAVFYVNTNTKASPTWTSVFPGTASIGFSALDPSVLQQASGTIASADITGTGAGQLGNANGVTIVAAPGAHKIIELVSCMVSYDFATAAYTGGGNLTVNNSAGGAALTGTLSSANSLGASADKVAMLYPLAAAGNPAVENGGLSLVAASAFTQPGTAAGVAHYIVTYRTLPTSLT